MSKWMYKIIEQHRELEGKFFSKKSINWVPDLNLKELGYDGWELVTVVPIGHGQDMGSTTTPTQILRHYFKKKIA